MFLLACQKREMPYESMPWSYGIQVRIRENMNVDCWTLVDFLKLLIVASLNHGRLIRVFRHLYRLGFSIRCLWEYVFTLLVSFV